MSLRTLPQSRPTAAAPWAHAQRLTSGSSQQHHHMQIHLLGASGPTEGARAGVRCPSTPGNPGLLPLLPPGSMAVPSRQWTCGKLSFRSDHTAHSTTVGHGQPLRAPVSAVVPPPSLCGAHRAPRQAS